MKKFGHLVRCLYLCTVKTKKVEDMETTVKFEPRPYEEVRDWLIQAKRRKREWEAKMQIRLAEIERKREESKARFDAFFDNCEA